MEEETKVDINSEADENPSDDQIVNGVGASEEALEVTGEEVSEIENEEAPLEEVTGEEFVVQGEEFVENESDDEESDDGEIDMDSYDDKDEE